MRRRPRPEVPSPRALARLRAGQPRGAGVRPAGEQASRPREFVARVEDLSVAPGRRVGESPEDGGGRHRRVLPPRHRWLRMPSALVGARWQPGRAAVLGMLVATVVAVLVLGLRVAWARSADDGEVVAPGGGARAGPSGVTSAAAGVGLPPGAGVPASVPAPGGARASATSSPGPPGSDAVVVVHVVGQVAHPGVEELPVGSRVSDAVAAAGGATSKADLSAINLARVLVDGEQVRVPKPGEVLSAAAGGAPGPGSGASTGPGAGLVPLNTADVAALDTLPGVGPVLAQRIVDWRTAHGRFTTVDELAEVSGIGEKLLAQLRPLVTT
ncbi:MAG TPA: ComEA family DNA-binding protein [Phycicoccus sp.]